MECQTHTPGDTMGTAYVATGDNNRTIDLDNDLSALVARVQARADSDDQTGATPHYVITPWTDGVEAGWRDEIHIYAGEVPQVPGAAPVQDAPLLSADTAARIREVVVALRDHDGDPWSNRRARHLSADLTRALSSYVARPTRSTNRMFLLALSQAGRFITYYGVN